MLQTWEPDASSPKLSGIIRQAVTARAAVDVITTTIYTTASGCQTCKGPLERTNEDMYLGEVPSEQTQCTDRHGKRHQHSW